MLIEFVIIILKINMHIALNIHWTEKTFLCNSRKVFLAFQLMQPKLFRYSNMKTHYDTLEISPQATHSEIKSSYYKLSMIYHPDKNKSEAAKKKFQNISEAYEVLGNHQSRKRYDRSITIKESIRKTTPKAAHTYASIYKSKTYPMNTKHFNFDVWTQKHYGEAFYRKQAEMREFSIQEEQRKNSGNGNEISTFFFAATFVITYLLVTCASSVSYDIPRKQDIDK